MLVPIHTDYFLRHIGVGIHIFSVGRYPDGELVAADCRVKAQVLHDSDDILIRYGNTKHIVYFLDRNLHFSGFNGITGVHIHMRGGNLTAAKLFN